MMNTFVFKPIADGFKNAIINIEASGRYYQAVIIDDLKTLKQMADETKNKGLEKWNKMMTKISEFLAAIPGKAEEVGQFLLKLGKGAGLILAGLIVLPFWLAFKGMELVYKLGEKLIETISNVCGDVWNEMTTIGTAIKTGYQGVQKVPVRENRKNIMSFNDFVKKS